MFLDAAAVGAAAVGEVVSEAGWINRPIEIFDAGKNDDGPAWADAGKNGSQPGADKAPGGRGNSSDLAERSSGGSDRRARLRELMGKKELTRGEQIFVMRAMNDGIWL